VGSRDGGWKKCEEGEKRGVGMSSGGIVVGISGDGLGGHMYWKGYPG